MTRRRNYEIYVEGECIARGATEVWEPLPGTRAMSGHDI
jgi:hypothetical protein